MEHRGALYKADRHGIYTPGMQQFSMRLCILISCLLVCPALRAFQLGIYDWKPAYELKLTVVLWLYIYKAYSYMVVVLVLKRGARSLVYTKPTLYLLFIYRNRPQVFQHHHVETCWTSRPSSFARSSYILVLDFDKRIDDFVRWKKCFHFFVYFCEWRGE